ncbi:peptidylprolyl isomerase, partial [Fulvivirga sp. RKSG066]|uniref:peptidylprolyl isomerase n=1 Tax=Fulvivirga aurantia TaxID=2529383 RepID=UPI0016282592
VYVYKKNNTNNDSAFTKSDVDDYLELYKKFKLKIAEAKSQGLDSTKEFIKEFNTYKEQLKKPYLTETKVAEKLVREAYDRYKTEVNASHILIKVDENASPQDTLLAYNKALELKQKANNGESFEILAKQYSEDPSAQRNGGNLGYFTSFQMVYPFETAAYETNVGEISDPVRTRFGYHIIKVVDKRPAQGSVTVSHLMLRMKPGSADSAAIQNKIFELHEQAIGGANWEQLVEQFSEDVNSKTKGGKLPPFKVGQMPYSFQEASFALEDIGSISDPVKTPYGWHIIRLEDYASIDSYEKMEASLKSRVKRDSRAEINRQALINRLKEENDFNWVDQNKALVLSYADSSLT